MLVHGRNYDHEELEEAYSYGYRSYSFGESLRSVRYGFWHDPWPKISRFLLLCYFWSTTMVSRRAAIWATDEGSVAALRAGNRGRFPAMS